MGPDTAHKQNKHIHSLFVLTSSVLVIGQIYQYSISTVSCWTQNISELKDNRLKTDLKSLN